MVCLLSTLTVVPLYHAPIDTWDSLDQCLFSQSVCLFVCVCRWEACGARRAGRRSCLLSSTLCPVSAVWRAVCAVLPRAAEAPVLLNQYIVTFINCHYVSFPQRLRPSNPPNNPKQESKADEIWQIFHGRNPQTLLLITHMHVPYRCGI